MTSQRSTASVEWVGPDRVFTDDDLASLDVPDLLRAGPSAELEGEGAVAAAIQLERDGAAPGDVLLAAAEVRADDVLVGEPPTRLDELVAAGLGVPGAETRERHAAWLERVAELMALRITQGPPR